MITANVILDSIPTNPQNKNRLTTVECTFHRFILAELNTHRVFSRSSASSRAIPVYKNVDKIQAGNIAYPVKWTAEQKGMSGADTLNDETKGVAKREWKSAAFNAAHYAEKLIEQNVHKSIVNRLLEPFMWHTAIISSTEWQNFFDQRCSPLAQPEMRLLAEAVQKAIAEASPVERSLHAPYIQNDEVNLDDAIKVRLSAARCARVSYLTHDGRRDYAADESLFQRLVTADPPHWSPLEHVATEHHSAFSPGNFVGWDQARHHVSMWG
jgi:thymidylate synthase ThyX